MKKESPESLGVAKAREFGARPVEDRPTINFMQTETGEFLVATLELIALSFLSAAVAAASSGAALVLAVLILAVGVISLFQPIRWLRVRSRWNAGALSVLGLVLVIGTSDGWQKDRRAAELAPLRGSDPAEYLTRLKECCKTRWVREVAELDPEAHQAWLRAEEARSVEEQRLEAARAEEERQARFAEEQRRAQAEQAELDAKVAGILKAIRGGDWAAADKALGRLGGGDLTAAYDELETAALVVVRPLPARDLVGNHAGYALLKKLRPDNAEYREKVEHYATRVRAVEEQAERAREAAEEAAESSANLHDTSKQAVWIAVTKDAVRDRLKDPGSAEFRDVRFHAYQGGTAVVCGQVNAKNEYGGYTGYQHFVGSGDVLVFLETEMEAAEFAEAWTELCFR